MARSKRSCLKIITCGGGRDSVEEEATTEGEGSMDKRRWSFRKRSTTTSSSASVISISISISEAVATDSLILNQGAAEYTGSLILIQAAIRGYLAHKNFLKLKNIVKLQAAFRGHLERRTAVGTLRCVQAIVKMQALVRARSARMSTIPNHHNQIGLGKNHFGPKANINYSPTEKLLSNGFARQLLESAPKKKRIPIKCDPSKADSAWKWLERWVSVSTPDSPRAQNPGSDLGYRGGRESSDSASDVKTRNPAEIVSNLVDLKHNKDTKEASPLKYEGNYDANNFKFQACHPSSFPSKGVKHKILDDLDSQIASNTSSKEDTIGIDMKLVATSQSVPISINKAEAGSEQARRSTKRAASELPESENKKFGFGSRNACNPAFSAVQSKFEMLGSSTVSGRSNNSSQVVGVELKFDIASCTAESRARRKDNCVAQDSVFHELKVPVGGSDCGTELSISSTLDSTNSSKVGGMELEHETEIMDKNSSEQNKMTHDVSQLENFDVTAINSFVSFEPNSSYAIFQQGKLEDDKGGSIEEAGLLLDHHPERSASYMQIQSEIPTAQQAYGLSPEESPRSHMIVPESHGTPSNQVSVNAKRNKLDKSGSGQSRKLLSADERSPSNPKHDSGARRNTEQISNDSKNGKRRNSFGSTRTDHVDQDSRGGSSNPLPTYMQATESARAKALTNSSPRSSPDVQDKHFYVKKRHSLPGANGKQVSPRMLRSMSQEQQGAKGNGTQTQDKKWVR